MQQIDIDFEVWKALTAKRRDESHSYNQVLRELLGIASEGADEPAAMDLVLAGRALGGRFLPNGTQLRAKYKGAWHHAEIKDAQLVDVDGAVYDSASAAARAVTSTNVNGLTFWDVKRPSDSAWRKLMTLSRQS